jgi:glycosyltransferase involved in cell wall biosynthesis
MTPIDRNKRFKILFVSYDKFPPNRVDVAVLFGKELSKRGLKIDYLLQSEADNNNFYNTEWSNSMAYVGPTDNGTTIFNRFFKHCLDLFNDLRMVKLIKDQRYTAIQVKDKFFTAIIALVVSKLSGCKFFFWLSFPFPEADIYGYNTGSARYPIMYLIRGGINKLLLYKVILPNSDHIFVQSNQMKKEIAMKGFSNTKITPVPMGVDIDDYLMHTKNKDCKNVIVPQSIVYIGAMEKIRKIDFIFRVFQKVLYNVPTAKLLMIGGSSNDKDLEDLKQEAKKLNIDQAVKFTDNLPRAEALEQLMTAVVGISPIEPNPIYIPSSPTKLIEYMLLGKPVVANDLPEQKKIIHESKSGFCVAYDEKVFAESIVRILRNPEEAKKMGENGRAYVMKYKSYKAIADIIERQYVNLLSL